MNKSYYWIIGVLADFSGCNFNIVTDVYDSEKETNVKKV